MQPQSQAGVLVRGPGTSTSDSIPAALSDGEVVIPADDVRRFGAAQLMAMVKRMGSQLPEPSVKEGVQHAAEGGMIADPFGPQTSDVSRVGNSYSGGNVSGNIAINGQAPGGTVNTVDAFKPPPPPPAASPALGAPAAVMPLSPKPVVPGAAQAPAVPAGTAPAAPASASMTGGGQVSWTGRPQRASGVDQLLNALAQGGQRQQPAAAPVAARAPLSSTNRQIFAGGALGYAQGGLVDEEDLSRPAFGFFPQMPSGGTPAVRPLAAQAQARAVDNTPSAAAAIAATPVAPDAATAAPAAAPASGLGPLSARGNVTDLGGSSAPPAERLAQLDRDIAFVKDKQTWRNPNDPAPGLAIIGPVDYANRNADFNDSAQLRTVLARGAPPGRNGAQVFQQQVDGAAMPLAERAHQRALQMKEQGATQRSTLEQQGLAARAQIADARQQEANSIDRARLGVDIYKSDQAARVAATKGGLTEDQAKSAGYAVRMENALKLIGGIGATNPGATRPGVGTAILNALPEGVANTMRREDRQRVEAAQLDALDAALTLNTGAAYTREQLQGMSRSYFAQPGDTDKTVAEKQQRLNSLIDTARLRAGPSGSTMADTAVQRAAATAPAAGPGAGPAAVPPGMSRQVGTSGGKPVYEDANGRRFIGG